MDIPGHELTIREFLPGDEHDFRRLNQEWIARYFAMEPKDEATLADPRQYILEPGGRIFLAILEGRTVGCCALLRTDPGEYEVGKMAVSESFQKAGIGRRLLEMAIAEARLSGATRLYLETSHRLEAAVRLYESLGFRHLAQAPSAAPGYQRTDVFMEMRLASPV